jgi:hypothetical protein
MCIFDFFFNYTYISCYLLNIIIHLRGIETHCYCLHFNILCMINLFIRLNRFSLLNILISFIFFYSPLFLRSESCFLSLSRDRVLCLLDPTPLSAGWVILMAGTRVRKIAHPFLRANRRDRKLQTTSL